MDESGAAYESPCPSVVSFPASEALAPFRSKQLGENADSPAELEKKLAEVLGEIRRCAPNANRATKQLVLDVGHVPMDELLDRAAGEFAKAVASEEGQEGTLAFVQKRPPKWAADE